jgi:hypothetical protein
VSDLVARLRLEAAGGDAAAAQVERVEDALRDVGQAAGGVSGPAGAAASGISRMGDEAQEAAADLRALGAAGRADFAAQYTAGAGQFVAASGRVNASAKLTGNEMLNLSRQFADVGVTAAMGMNPLMILVQQGPQIAETLATASARGVTFSGALSAMAGSAWAAVAPLAPFIAGAAAVAAVIGGGLLIATKELNKEHGNLAAGLGLTDEQLKKVQNTGVTMGDVLGGTFDAAGAALATAFAPQIEWLKDAFSTAYQAVVDGTLATTRAIFGAFGATFAGLAELFRNFPAILGDATVTAANLVIAGMERMINLGAQGLNQLIATANAAAAALGLAVQIPEIDSVNLGRVKNQFAGAGRSLAAAMVEGYAGGIRTHDSALAATEEAIIARSKRRVEKEAGEAKAVRETTQALKDKIKAVGDLLTIDRSTIGQGGWVLGSTKADRVENLVPTTSLGEGLRKQEEELKRLIDDVAFHMEDEFARRGKLAFGDIADFAGEELRRAIYQQILAKPFQIMIDATIRGIQTTGLGGLVGTAALGASLVGGRVGNAAMTGLNTFAATSALATGLGAGAATIGGGIGAGMAGAAALLGPAAPVIAVIAGLATLIGSLQKPTNAGAGFDLVSGQLSGNKRTAETERAATAAGETILQGQQLLRDAGIQLTTTVNGLVVGTRDLSQIYLSNGRTLTSAVGDAAGAADTALKAVLAGATYVSDAQKSLVDGMLAAGQGFDAIATALQGYASAQGIPQQIEDAILAITNPQGSAVAELERAQAEQRKALKAAADAGYLTAAQFATASERLAVLEGLQMEETLKRFVETVSDTAEALAERAGRLSGGVGDRILELTNPAAARVKRINDEIDARIAEAQPLIAAGVLGQDFIGLAEQLRALELDALFKDLAGQVDTAGKAFADARPRLLAWMDELKGGARSELSPKAARAEALSQYERTLALAQGGDRNALSSITSYAHRLIDADRAATSSAQARAALRERVLGQVGGLAAGGASETTAGAIAALSVPLTTLAQAANLDLAAQATGGRAVVVSNLPAMSAMYGQALAGQTDRLVAANDRSREEIVAALRDLAAQQANLLAGVAGAVEGAVAASLAAAAASSAEISRGLAVMAEEARLADARARAGLAA